MQKKKLTEADFGKQVVEILRSLGFETWQEVYVGTGSGLGNPCIDIIARLGRIYIAFELKLHLNDDVLIQACRNRSYVDYTIALVPYNRKSCKVSTIKAYYIKSFGIGVYAINLSIFVKYLEKLKVKGLKAKDILNELIGSRTRKYFFRIEGCSCYNEPKRITRKRKRRKKGKLLIETYLFEEQKGSIAGSQGDERSTPFKRSCAKIQEYLKQHPEATRKDVWNALGEELHWKNYNSMYSSFRVWHDKLDCMKNIVFTKVKERK